MAQRIPPQLFVEGPDDEHTLGQLLLRHRFAPTDLPEFRDAGGKDGVLRSIRTATKASAGNCLGFVLDANDDLDGRWRAVAARLHEAGVDAPDQPPAEGFVGESDEYRTRVGIWVMPDNRSTGALEDFLKELIAEEDSLIRHAEESVSQARALGARFRENDTRKAVLHTWLAWQKEPGRPYGVAVKQRYFRSDSETALSFLAWFSRVFEIVGDAPQPS